MKALSIRQPWAWLIVNGYKTVENRSRSLGDHFDPLLIHASSTMTKQDYEYCVEFLRCNLKLQPVLRHLPSACTDVLQLGGIVGKVEVTAIVGNLTAYDWYTGAIGYELKNAKPLPFKACKGRLGFFDVDYEALP